MPFRVPSGYSMLAVGGSDPSNAHLAEYIVWLKAELETAEACLESRLNNEMEPAAAKPKAGK